MNGIDVIISPGCRIIPDTSALIHLGKLDLLDTVTACLPLVIPTAVLVEYRQCPADHTRPVRPLEPGPTERIRFITPRIVDFLPLSGGEEACVATYLQLKADDPALDLVIVTDDRQACTTCRRYRIPFLNTPLLICALVRRGCLSPERGREAVRHNLILGRYSDTITRVIRNHVKTVTGRKLS